MKIYLAGGQIVDPNKDWCVIELSAQDKVNLHAMHPNNNLYGVFPEGTPQDTMNEIMETCKTLSNMPG